MTMQGCPGEEWALKAYAIYKECAARTQPVENLPWCAQGAKRGEADGL